MPTLYRLTGITTKMMEIATETRLREKITRKVAVEMDERTNIQKYNPPL